MRKILSFILCPTLAWAALPSPNQLALQQMNSGGTAFQAVNVTPIAGQALGFNGSLTPTPIPLTVSSLSALAALPVGSLVTGYNVTVAAPNGGVFTYTTPSALTADGVMVISPALGSGQWVRVYDSWAIKPEWWGAVAYQGSGAYPAGYSASTTTAAIQSALNWANSLRGGRVVLEGGRYQIQDTLQIIGNYNGSTYPENDVIGVGLHGAGQHATRIEWGGSVPLQTARKAMVFMSGFTFLNDLQLICTRKYESLGAPATNTPYYGIVLQGTAWQMDLRNLDVKYVHVPFSANTIYTYRTSGPYGLEFEPPAGVTTLSADVAQFTAVNCRFEAKTQEFFDGTLNAATQINANGTNLSLGTAASSYYEASGFSDGSYTAEVVGQPSVNSNFVGCQFYQDNPNTNGVIRLDTTGDINFTDCLFGAAPPNGTYSYTFFENCPSTGSNVYCNQCYFMGGIFTGAESQGTLSLIDCNGENSSSQAYGGVVQLIAPLGSSPPWVSGNSYTVGQYVNSVSVVYKCISNVSGTTAPASDASHWTAQYNALSLVGMTLNISSLWVGRGSQTKSIILSTGTAGAAAVAPFGATNIYTGSQPRYILNNLSGISQIQFGQEIDKNLTSISPKKNLVPNLPASLAGKAVSPTFLSPGIYRQTGGDAYFSTNLPILGSQFLIADQSQTSQFSPQVPVDPNSAYNFSLDVYVSSTTSIGNNELEAYIKFYTSAGASISGVGCFFLGSYTPTFGYSSLLAGQVVRFTNRHIIPPTNAAYAAIVCNATPTNSRTIGFANLRIWQGPLDAVTDWQPAPSYAASAAPTTGTWAVGDYVANTSVTSTTTPGWYCTTGGTPGTWTAAPNL